VVGVGTELGVGVGEMGVFEEGDWILMVHKLLLVAAKK
jgi:hypothetical protein